MEQYLGGGCRKTPETQELTVIWQCKEWLATIPDGKLPTNQKTEG